MTTPPVPEKYYTMLEELQAIDFVLVELTLYLDTHPSDTYAIQQFNSFAQHRAGLKNLFESEFGPLQNYGNSPSKVPWEWSKGPWPWQI